MREKKEEGNPDTWSVKLNTEEDRTAVVVTSDSVAAHPERSTPSLAPSLCECPSDSA